MSTELVILGGKTMVGNSQDSYGQGKLRVRPSHRLVRR